MKKEIMPKNPDNARIKQVLDSLPATEKEAQSFFHTLDQGGKFLYNLKPGVLNNLANASYNLGINLSGTVNSLGSVLYNGILAYAESSDVNKDLIDPIFETLNENKDSRDKFISTLSAVFKGANDQIKHNYNAVLLMKAKDQEIIALQDELKTYLQDNKKDWQFFNQAKRRYNRSIKEYEELEIKEANIRADFDYEQMDDDLNKIAAKKEQLSEVAMEYGNKMGSLQFLEDTYQEFNQNVQKLQKERDAIALNLGVISSSLIYYDNILQDINNKDFLNAVLTTPEYKFVFNKSQDQLQENEINIKNERGKIILESNLGYKTLELTGLSKELEEQLLAENLDILTSHKNELQKVLKKNNFPGVLHHAYKNVDTFLKMPAEMDPEHPEMAQARTEMVNGVVDLLVQKHVKETLKPLATEKLVDDIFELPQISPKIKEYHQLVKDMARTEPNKFKNLFEAILESKAFPQYVNDLMNFIGSPSIPETIDPKTGKKILNENSAEFNKANQTYDKSMVSLIEALEPNVITKAIPLINGTLVRNIMDLPVLKDLEKEEVIAKAKSEAEELNNKFLDIIKTLKINALHVANATRLMTEGSEAKNLSEIYVEAEPVQSVDGQIPSAHAQLVEAEPVQSLEEQIASAKAKLEELQKSAVDEKDKKIYNGILKSLEEKNVQKLQEYQQNLERNITNSYTKRLEKERRGTPKNQSNEISPTKKKLVETIYKIANSKEDYQALQNAIISNKETLEQALDVVFNPKEKTAISEVLKDFGITSKEIINLLPKLCNQNVIKALGCVVENPSITNIVNLLYQTNYLGAAIAHAGQGLCSYAYKRVAKTFVSDVKNNVPVGQVR